MTTTAVTAGQIMDRAANLLNDPNKTDYNYRVMIPYLNMAIEELSELLEESNSSPTTRSVEVITVPIGASEIVSREVGSPNYPDDLIEIQEVGEKLAGTRDSFIPLVRKEYIERFPPNQSLLFWCWEDQRIKFNPNGALSIRDIQLKYICQGVPYISNENSVITMINSRSYLAYKTAAFCAMFIGENESRAAVLEQQAEKAAERTMNISSKGRQQIMTRHRPFRAAYKLRGGY